MLAMILATACDDKNESNPSEFIFQPGEATEVEVTDGWHLTKS